MHLGLVGYGNIGKSLLDLLGAEDLARVTVLARPGKAVAHPRAEVAETTEALIAARPDLLVECAGHAAVRETVLPALKAGIDVVLVSIGALSDAALETALHRAAQDGGAMLILPAGAIGGIDLLAAMAPAGGLEVRYTGTKPPQAWRGTPAEDRIDLDGLTEATVFFSGTARDVAQAFPKNANVAATLALAGAGMDATQVELVADPTAAGNRHAYAVTSPLGDYEIRIDNRASNGNAKTSAATIYSVLREIRNRKGPVVI
ncbi:aspartate dehydrogenase [Pseudosulfitobacter sp. DSM 107133]|uniref:aspartate dehydrogenase n=1 Tax=Pseudosulfitobacter sp. DSM 107133 TaxID=2883100 RepID=UPI000DF397C3|nr:aspartate dehydrogenase [Pseudosulfitobacter sp. DSM 107133]UOA29317.1 L-aspartate dehydrogenase [Pseudosulfitobacter sp. DSM 107133]